MKSSSSKLRSLKRRLDIYAEHEYIRILDYERLRSERNKIPFSQVVLQMDTDGIRNRSLSAFLGGILRQLRITDQIGWLDTDQIGIILPGTDEVGVQGFLDKIEPSINATAGVIVGSVSTFPTENQLLNAVSSSPPSQITMSAQASDILELEEVAIIPFDTVK